MSPNSPEHQLQKLRSCAIAELGRQKIFSRLNDGYYKAISDARDTAIEIQEKRAAINLRNSMIAKEENKETLPRVPRFPTTPKAGTSNVGRGEVVNAWEATHHLKEPHAGGTAAIAIDASLQWICDYANRWHSALSGVPRHRPNNDPMFYCFQTDFLFQLREDKSEDSHNFLQKFIRPYLTPEKFWKLRYLFIPILYGWTDWRDGSQVGHSTMMVISPEAKTMEFLCSNGDTGLATEWRGARCFEQVFKWLAYFLRSDKRQFQLVPSEWRMRTTAGESQGYAESRHIECGLFSTTHVQSLAFGYGVIFFKWEDDPTIKRFMKNRGFRLSQDLYLAGFSLYKTAPSEDEAEQYYPLLDTPPEDGKDTGNGWTCLVNSVMDALPPFIRHIKPCYVLCPGKNALRDHCRRNQRFYPGWDHDDISGRKVSFDNFLSWVLEMDWVRLHHKCVGLPKTEPYEKGVEGYQWRWIDPTDETVGTLWDLREGELDEYYERRGSS